MTVYINAKNTYPITLEFELRPPPSLSLESVRSGVAAVTAEVGVGFPALRLSLRELRANPGYRAVLDSEVVTLTRRRRANEQIPTTTWS